MPAILQSPPRHVCINRLSAIGDTCHVLAVVRALQRAWPETRFTWIIGRVEARLIGLADEIELLTFDKRGGLGEYTRLRRELAGRRFDALLHMQLALRASLLAMLVKAPVRAGFDRARAREGQWLFTNRRIAAGPDEHVLDVLMRFADLFGVARTAPSWNLPIPAAARSYAEAVIPEDQPTLVISACSSHPQRNWRPERYAAVADHAAREHGMRVVLAGSPAPVERNMADAILAAAREPIVDQVGGDTLPQLLAVLQRATALLTPDSGPAHMATMVGTPVLGLYAATSSARSGPYLSLQWCVDRHDAAARQYLGRSAAEIPWGTKIERPGVMDLIEVDDVIERLQALLDSRRPGSQAL